MIIPFKQDEGSYAYPLRVWGTLGILVDVRYRLLFKEWVQEPFIYYTSWSIYV